MFGSFWGHGGYGHGHGGYAPWFGGGYSPWFGGYGPRFFRGYGYPRFYRKRFWW